MRTTKPYSATLAALAVAMAALSTTPTHAKKQPSSKLFIREGDLLPATILRVLVIPFTTGTEKAAHHGHTISRVIREEFEAREFEVVDPADVEAALKAAPLPSERPLQEAEALAMARELDADWVAFGHIETIDVKSSRLFGISVPGRKYASISLHTAVLETATGDAIFRHATEISESVGNTWFTASEVARVRILARCADHLYDPLFQRLPPVAENVYKGMVFVADGLQLDPFTHKIAVVPFVDQRGFVNEGILAGEITRGQFEDRGFYVHRLDEAHYEYIRRGLDRDENDDPATLADIGRHIGADFVVHGKILYLDLATKSIPGSQLARLPVPLPGRIRASCVLKVKVVDVKSGRIVYRSHRKADDSAVGAQWLTRGHEARKKILRRCVRYCFEDLLDLLPQAVATK